MCRRLVFVLAVVATCLLPACAASRDGGGLGPSPCRPQTVDPGAAHELESGGQDRRYLLTMPEAPPGPNGYPLVVSLHGHGSSAADHEANTSLAAAGGARGFVVATPDALGDPRRWNFDRRAGGPDDYVFVARLVDELAERACVDPARTFLAGSSNGAAFAGLLACTGDVRVVAVAMVIATVPPTCAGDIRPSVLTIRGTADATVPYGDTPEFVAEWARHGGCASSPDRSEPHPGVTRTAYAGCASGGRVVLDTVAGGAHAWPGSAGADRPDNSASGAGYPATDAVVSFFSSVAGGARDR